MPLLPGLSWRISGTSGHLWSKLLTYSKRSWGRRKWAQVIIREGRARFLRFTTLYVLSWVIKGFSCSFNAGNAEERCRNTGTTASVPLSILHWSSSPCSGTRSVRKWRPRQETWCHYGYGGMGDILYNCCASRQVVQHCFSPVFFRRHLIPFSVRPSVQTSTKSWILQVLSEGKELRHWNQRGTNGPLYLSVIKSRSA